MRKASILVVVALTCGLMSQTAPALAQDEEVPMSVTLKASDTRFEFGSSTVLSGRIEPRAQGEQVDILDDEGNVVASTTTDDEGRYKLRYSPSATEKLTAQWLAAFSEPVTVRVRALVSAALRGVKIFDKARVWGRIRPRHKGERVTLRIKRGSRTVATKQVRLRKGAFFKTRVRIEKPGRYKVIARFADDDHLPGIDHTDRRATKLPSLSVGSRGGYVKLLEKRLRRLGYHLPKANKSYDYKTSDAMIAFNKVQGRSRIGSVGRSTWKALASPKTPRPRSKSPKFHIEVDQTKQVLYVVRRGKVQKILHVSTGANGYTHDGVFDFDRKLAGYSPGRLYYPSYFDGLRAIHGWPEVPTYPASHGCVRVPMWAAQWIFGQIEVGNIIRIYH